MNDKTYNAIFTGMTATPIALAAYFALAEPFAPGKDDIALATQKCETAYLHETFSSRAADTQKDANGFIIVSQAELEANVADCVKAYETMYKNNQKQFFPGLLLIMSAYLALAGYRGTRRVNRARAAEAGQDSGPSPEA